MSSPFNQFWYRIAALKPRLRRHVEIHRHHYRGRLWYVLQDHGSQRQHRLSPAAYAFIGLMDGQLTIGEISELAETRLGDQAPTQNDIVQILAQLHAADALQCDVPPDIAELLLRHERAVSEPWRSRLLNPLSWSFPLIDPERFLTPLLPFVRPLLGRAGGVFWLVIIGFAALQAANHWSELTHDVTDRILTPPNMVVLWLLFPLIKILHELGHGLAVKAFGGEVHEMGVLVMALQPLPYVDASAATAFRSKYQRILVGAAGMMVELLIASLALFIWIAVEPGLIRSIAYNVIFIGGASTVLFNANPLLRYDGYYMLADYLEMPNLDRRARAYIRYLCERYLFGQRESVAEPATGMERLWLILYPIAAFIYRFVVLAAIALFLAGKFFFIGVLLALAGVAAWLLVPLARTIIYLCTSPCIHSVRRRALCASGLSVVVLVGAVLWVPLPLRTRAEGVVSIPEHARLRAAVDGFVERVVARPGSQVSPGDVLIVCRDPELTARVKVLQAQLDELETRYMAQWLVDIKHAQLIKDEIVHIQERLARAREKLADLVIRSRARGIFEINDPNLPGRYVRQGASLGYVLDLNTLTVRVVVPEADVELVRHHTRRVELRLAEHPAEILRSLMQREIPAASGQLPSNALGSQGGGTIVVDPLDKEGVKSVEKIFQFDLALPPNSGIRTLGGRVYVRFDHGWEPVASRWQRQLRQLFLSGFYV